MLRVSVLIVKNIGPSFDWSVTNRTQGFFKTIEYSLVPNGLELIPWTTYSNVMV
jgi:hypothetical protein